MPRIVGRHRARTSATRSSTTRAPGPPHWREAGARWLAADGWAPDPQCVVPTIGVHAAVMAVIAAMTAPGDKIAFEQLTYSSIARSANLIGRRSIVVGMRRAGADPGGFRAALRAAAPEARLPHPVAAQPDADDHADEPPPRDRRHRAQAQCLADRGFDLRRAARRAADADLAQLAPERTFHVGGLSKTVAAGVRGGWVACPPTSRRASRSPTRW